MPLTRSTCANCGFPIRLAAVVPPVVHIWDHPDHGHRVTCPPHDDATRTATPRR